jgi:hypothetical protein
VVSLWKVSTNNAWVKEKKKKKATFQLLNTNLHGRSDVTSSYTQTTERNNVTKMAPKKAKRKKKKEINKKITERQQPSSYSTHNTSILQLAITEPSSLF